MSNNTINHYGAMLVKVFSWATNEELITHVPKFKYRKVKGNKRPLYFTKSQIDFVSSIFLKFSKQANSKILELSIVTCSFYQIPSAWCYVLNW